MELEPDLSPLRPTCTCGPDIECLVCKAYRLKIPLSALQDIPTIASQVALQKLITTRRIALHKLTRRRQNVRKRLQAVPILEEELSMLNSTIAHEQHLLAQQQRLMDGSISPSRHPRRRERMAV